MATRCATDLAATVVAAGDSIDRDRLVEDAMPLVGYCVAAIAARVPGHVRRDDLSSAAMLGLAQASKSWDPDRGVSFEQFARPRINGALLDELRSRDWASRSARRNARRLHLATETLTGRLGRTPDRQELADELGIGVDEVDDIREDVDRSTVLHLDAFDAGPTSSGSLPDDAAADPINQLLGQEMRGYLRDAVVSLPERLRTVVVGYFFEDRPMRDIAADLGVTISRVSQLRAEAIRMLRDGIGAQFSTPDPAGADAVVDVAGADRKRAQYRAAVAHASDFANRVSSESPGVIQRLQAV